MKAFTQTANTNGLVYLSCPPVLDEAVQALDRLTRVAAGDFDNSQLVGRFLLSRRDGQQNTLELTELRALDPFIFADCIRVLVLIYDPTRQIHEYLPNGSAIWAALETRYECRRMPV